MGEHSNIPWTDHTFNPWWGCTKISAGCDRCYAEKLAIRYGCKLWGLGPGATRRTFSKKHWAEPLKWNKKAAAAGQRHRVFCASMCDLFEDLRELNPIRADVWSLIEQTPALDWLLLTKRPEHMTRMVPKAWTDGWPSNVWAMTTVEDQDVAEQRINALLKVPARIRGISIEPMLGPVDLGLRNWAFIDRDDCRLDWVIVGCESGPGRRACFTTWVRNVIEDCDLAAVSVFVKQFEVRGKVQSDPACWPKDLRRQEFPTP